jgi:hypothetical protein
MSEFRNPAVEAFIAAIGDELVMGQVCMRRGPSGYVLCHVSDRDKVAAGGLRLVTVDELRGIAASTDAGAFRPLKSAPNLRTGWRVEARGAGELERALEHLYPGGVADWHAARSGPAAATHYREFTGRQTGMYRVTTMLSDAQAGAMIRACCHGAFCLKQRLWTVEGLAADEAGAKSVIPCLEPCAVLLEFARKAARIEQGERVPLGLSEAECSTIREALEAVLLGPATVEREADFGAATNPRRVRLVLDKVETALGAAAAARSTEG